LGNVQPALQFAQEARAIFGQHFIRHDDHPIVERQAVGGDHLIVIQGGSGGMAGLIHLEGEVSASAHILRVSRKKGSSKAACHDEDMGRWE